MNEIEQKEIEEMAKDIYEQKSCDTSFEGNCKILAYDLVTLGYRNCKNKVVIDEEEYNKLKNLEKYHITLEDLSEYVSAARKETAREIVKALKNMAYQSNDWSHGVHPMVVEVDYIEEIAEDYGVEVEE